MVLKFQPLKEEEEEEEEKEEEEEEEHMIHENYMKFQFSVHK